MHAIVTGGAGFIGSHVTERLLADGHRATVIDNFSTGDPRFLESSKGSADLDVIDLDLYKDPDRLPEIIAGAEVVFHLSANADVRFGWDAPYRDLQQNVLATHNLLEAMRLTEVGRMVFSSTGSVYGEATQIPTREDAPFPTQTSLYGASKLGAEGLIQAYTEGTGMVATIFRFVSILGPRYTHGHIVDFMHKLRRDPDRLEILGDGKQRKSYLDVTDCIEALMTRVEVDQGCEVFNLGTDSHCTVTESAGWICERLGVQPILEYTGGSRGWIGDNPYIHLDTSKIRATGWRPRFTIREGVERTVDYLIDNPWILDSHASGT